MGMCLCTYECIYVYIYMHFVGGKSIGEAKSSMAVKSAVPQEAGIYLNIYMNMHIYLYFYVKGYMHIYL
jgi:hypothetical protein